MVFNEINGIEQYFLNVKEIEQDEVTKFCLELYYSVNLDNFTLKLQKIDKNGIILTNIDIDIFLHAILLDRD